MTYFFIDTSNGKAVPIIYVKSQNIYIFDSENSNVLFMHWNDDTEVGCETSTPYVAQVVDISIENKTT
jgi:hypothetical protein